MNDEVKIIFRAVDQVSSTFFTISRTAKNTANGISSSIGGATNQLTTKLSSFKGTLRTHLSDMESDLSRFAQNLDSNVGIAAGAGFAALSFGIKEAVDASNAQANAFAGLDSIAGKLGVDVLAARDAAVSLSSDGLMPLSESVAALKNLLASRFSLDQATALLEGFKDSAAFGRQAALGYGEAIVSATEGIKNQNSVLVDNAGLTKNLSNIMQEAGLSIDDMGRITSDTAVRTSFYNGLLKELAIFEGDAARLSREFSGEQARSAASTQEMAAAIGDALKPVLTEALQLVTSVTDAIGDFAGENPRTTAVVITTVAAVLGLTTGFVGLVKAGGLLVGTLKTVAQASKLAQMSMGPLGIILGALTAAFVAFQFSQARSADAANQVKDSANSAAAALTNQGNAAQKAGEQTVAASEKVRDINKQIADEEYNYNKRRVEIITQREESLKKAREGLEEESATFKKTQEDNLKEFNETVSEIEARHAERTEKIVEDLEEEKRLYAEASEEQITRNEETLKSFQESEDSRLKNLEKTLQSGLKVGSKTYEQDLKNYKDVIAKEKAESKRRLQEKSRDLDKEVVESRQKHEKKLSDLQAALAKENESYTKDIQLKKTKFEEETALQQAEHLKRTEALQKTISEDEAFLQKHAQAVKTINRDKVDDELAELDRKHTDTIRKLNEQKAKEVGIAGDTVLGIQGAWNGLELEPIQLTDYIQFDIRKFGEWIVNGILQIFADIGDTIFTVLFGIVKSTGLFDRQSVDNIMNDTKFQYFKQLEGAGNLIKNPGSIVKKFATGGDYYTRGPEWIMVGDNPGGVERVQVTPVSSPNINGPKAANGNITIVNNNNFPVDPRVLLGNNIFQMNAII